MIMPPFIAPGIFQWTGISANFYIPEVFWKTMRKKYLELLKIKTLLCIQSFIIQ